MSNSFDHLFKFITSVFGGAVASKLLGVVFLCVASEITVFIGRLHSEVLPKFRVGGLKAFWFCNVYTVIRAIVE